MAQTHQLSSYKRMANAVLGGLEVPTTIQAYLSTCRRHGLSYEEIARDLHGLTNGVVSLSANTVKRWFKDFGLLDEVAS